MRGLPLNNLVRTNFYLMANQATEGDSNSESRTAEPVKIGLRHSKTLRVFALATFIAGGLIGIGFLVGGKLVAEKTLTRFVMPYGVLWLLVSGWTLERVITLSPKRFILPVLGWLLLSLASCGPLSNACVSYLEGIETPYRPAEEPPLDMLVVLGGGTHQGPERAQAGFAGDRVVYAAELFHQGHTKRLITTGESLEAIGGERSSPSQQTIEIWTSLGIPRDAIDVLSGRNTYEEIEDLKAKFSDLEEQRVGLLTSAWHLPRAMRLARAQELGFLIPVAADYQTSSEPPTFLNYLPSSGALEQLARCQHEWLAWLVNR